jgi:hypothetical protein
MKGESARVPNGLLVVELFDIVESDQQLSG